MGNSMTVKLVAVFWLTFALCCVMDDLRGRYIDISVNTLSSIVATSIFAVLTALLVR